jgi:hypothetical protein
VEHLFPPQHGGGSNFISDYDGLNVGIGGVVLTHGAFARAGPGANRTGKRLAHVFGAEYVVGPSL